MNERKAALQDENQENNEPMIIVGYNPNDKMFYLRSRSGKSIVFECSLFKENFEALTARMIRLVKDVNLLEAEEYKKRKAMGECTADLTENRKIPQQANDEQKA